jgi:hypothetical protein
MAITQKDLPKFFTSQKSGSGTRVNADGAGALGADTNGVAVYTGVATYGSIVTSLLFSSTDTAAMQVFVYILNGSTVRPLGIVNIPIQSGDVLNAPSIDAISGSGITIAGLPRDAQGKAFIPLEPGEVLKFSMKAAVTSTKTVIGTALALDGTA